MATQEDMIKITQRGVNNFAALESALERAVNSLTDLEKDFLSAGTAGMEKMNKIVRIVHRLRMAKGDISKVAAEVYDLHDIGTAMAKKNNADVALPEGGFVIFGGGGR